MADRIDRLDGSLIQHGKYNDRIYLMKLGDGDVPGTIMRLDEMAQENGYTKVMAKIPASASPEFEAHGYKSEAAIPGFFHGTEPAFFMAKYFQEARREETDPDTVRKVLDAAREKAGEGVTTEFEPRFRFTGTDESDAEEISKVYGKVFDSYPFPIYEKEYILQTMEENVVYFCIREGDTIVSVASSEMDEESENVEMTDFATLPEYRGHSFAVFLLDKMEEAMVERGMKTAYTIARSYSFGMNITFAKLGYLYGGTLTSNTNICGNMESMNIWYKPLGTPQTVHEG